MCQSILNSHWLQQEGKNSKTAGCLQTQPLSTTVHPLPAMYLETKKISYANNVWQLHSNST